MCYKLKHLLISRSKLSQAIKDDTGFIPAIHTSIETIKQDKDRAQLESLKAWISPTDVVSQQSDILRRRHEGTGQWFLNTSEFAEWLRPSNTGRTLFCVGIPGAGKTMLAAVTINHLMTKMQSSTTGIAWLYCNYKSRNEQTEIELLAALLKHLVQDETPGVVKIVKTLQEQCASRKSKPALEELKKTLQDVLASLSTVYIVIDALDECPSDDGTRRQLLACIRELQSCTDLRLMVTSRHIHEITDKFQDATTIEVRAHDEDVTRFVTGQMDRLPRCIQRDAELQKLVQEKITGAIDGM
jgi:Cdc6-like AAA superfamily ATPase